MTTSDEQKAVLAAWAEYARVAQNPQATEEEIQTALDVYIDAVCDREDAKPKEVAP